MDKTLPSLLRRITREYPTNPAQFSKDADGAFRATDFATFFREVSAFAAGLLSIGVSRGSHIGLISENRKEWFIADLAVLSIGAADVPRGCDSMPGELAYILEFADCETVIVEDEKQLRRLLAVADDMPKLKRFIVLDRNFTPAEDLTPQFEYLGFDDITARGDQLLAEDPERIEREIDLGNPDDTATIIFTSGTTGVPKGVMLSHNNFLHQVRGVPQLLNVGPGDIWLCVLPVWHSFERVMQYVALGTASALAYSKPIGKVMLSDMASIRPTWMASVPRIWESIKAGVYSNIRSQGSVKRTLFHFFVAVGSTHAHFADMVHRRLPQFRKRSRLRDIALGIVPYLVLTPFRKLGDILVFRKIRDKLGGRFVAGISGGGALPEAVDKFFAAAGVLLLEGYGLTETAPVLAVRSQHHPVPGTVGPVFPGTEIRIADENGNTLDPGEKGLILARGPQVMLGYYKRPEDTRKVLAENGWFDTGDLGMLTWNNELKITGRAKDTIVLLGGENVEPAPIEEKLRESEYIEHAVVVGQDQKFLAALIVANNAALETFAKDNNLPYMSSEQLIGLPEVNDLLDTEVKALVNQKTGFRSFEQIYRFTILPKPFEVGHELSQKQEIKRHAIYETYRQEIERLFR